MRISDVNAIEKPTIVHPSDETAEVSESDSDFGSEHSFSIAPCTDSDDDDDDVIPTKNNNEHDHSMFSVEAETVRLGLVTPYSSRVELNDEKDCSIDDIKLASSVEKKLWSGQTKKWFLFVTILLTALFGYRASVLNSYDITSSREINILSWCRLLWFLVYLGSPAKSFSNRMKTSTTAFQLVVWE